MGVLELLFSSGGIGVIFSLLVVVIGGFYVHRSAITQAEKTQREAYEGAIDATKQHINALQERIKELERQNKHMRELTDAILEILKTRDIHISIHGHMVSIREGKDTTVMRLREKVRSQEEEESP